MRGEVRLQGSPPGAATASSPNYISQQPERPERRERRALRGLLQSRRSPGDLPPPTTRWGLGSVASGEPCCGQDVGKGRSPTGPAEAGGPRRCRERLLSALRSEACLAWNPPASESWRFRTTTELLHRVKGSLCPPPPSQPPGAALNATGAEHASWTRQVLVAQDGAKEVSPSKIDPVFKGRQKSTLETSKQMKTGFGFALKGLTKKYSDKRMLWK
ncbi:uncharacterized protein LOC132231823 [Myotis daubentonii]|uniref:uncharacterized protein LOC132231823 n=1 Tax=Myotis daubentonii TaxID=98922 RepID=UPI0028735E1D|nr:uncharacterized protein LOC132231823 [Myotis daubentonii]